MRLKTITAACALAGAAALSVSATAAGTARSASVAVTADHVHQATNEGNTFDFTVQAAGYGHFDANGNTDVGAVSPAEWNTMVPE